mmetsp:Transcript_126015/g.317920  ORF Transcript_126015/g.317920 Transcript_126015/m.317920 type:complete len:297 (+) Transcript_126015:106-996(+)
MLPWVAVRAGKDLRPRFRAAAAAAAMREQQCQQWHQRQPRPQSRLSAGSEVGIAARRGGGGSPVCCLGQVLEARASLQLLRPSWRALASAAQADAPKEGCGGGAAGPAPPAEGAADSSPPQPTLEERVQKLEATVKAQEAKLAEVEKLAKRKGMMMQLVMQYGAPFALWYGTVWASMWFGIYGLLEMEIVSWQESLRPLLSNMGMEGTADRIDPSMGNLVLAFLVNECAEPIRFPLVLATGAPVIKAFQRLRGGSAAAAAGTEAGGAAAATAAAGGGPTAAGAAAGATGAAAAGGS